MQMQLSVGTPHGLMAGRFQETPGSAGLFLLSHGRSVIRRSPMATRLIAYADLANKGIRYSKPQLWRMEKTGKFPKRVPIGAARYAYVEAEIDAHIEALIAVRDTTEAA